MTAHGVTQVDLAGKLGVHQTTVSMYLHGRVPSLDLALAIRRVTSIPVEAWSEPPSKRESLPPTGT